MSASFGDPASRRASAAVVAMFALSCLWFTGFFPSFANPNELSRFQTVVAFVERGTFAIDEELAALGDHEDKAASGGRFYSNKAPGLALAAIPVYALLRLFLPPPDSPDAAIFFLLRLLTVSLAAVVALARFARRSAVRAPQAAPLVAFAVAFGTPLLFYARSFFGHAWTAALLFLAWDALRPPGGAGRRRRVPGALLAGVLAGLAVISEYTVAPVAVVLAARAIFGRSAERGGSALGRGALFSAALRRGAYFAAGAAGPLLVLLLYQAVCFGSPFVPSYAREAYPAYADLAARRFFGFTAPSGRVALDYLVHPARGIVLLCPFFLWAAPGFVAWWRSARRVRGNGDAGERVDCAFALAATAATFVLLTGYPNWHGGWALGSRYLLALVFISGAALPFALRRRLWRGLFAAAAIFAAAFHVLAASSWAALPLDFSFPAATGALWFLERGWAAPNLGTVMGLPPVASLLVPAIAAGVAAVSALRAARPLAPAAPIAALLGAAALVLLLLSPPRLSYPARLLRAAIYGDYSGRDPRREELARVVAAASTPLERRQAEVAWKTSGPR